MVSEETQNPSSTTVLVTGGSGYLGSFVILQLLAAGYTVYTTIRNLDKEKEVRQSLQNGGAEINSHLSFFAADLAKDDGWAEAVKGCTYVLHVASPFPPGVPKTEDELIVPARDGALRVLRAARDAGVKRVVMTSSFAAIGYGHEGRTEPFTEKDWSVLDGKIPVPAYHKSKTLAERAAWDFIQKEGGSMELTVLNPPAIFGPVLSADYSLSIQIIQKLVDGSIPACPQIAFGIVDVRDLADLQIRAMVDPKARNERFIGQNNDGIFFMIDIANVIKKSNHAKAAKVPTRQLPNWLVRIVSFFDPSLALMTPELGQAKHCSNEKAKTILGWEPRPSEETILDTVNSLVKHNIV